MCGQPRHCQLKKRMAAFLREVLQRLDLGKIVVRGKTLLAKSKVAKPRSGNKRLAAMIFPGQHTAGQREKW